MNLCLSFSIPHFSINPSTPQRQLCFIRHPIFCLLPFPSSYLLSSISIILQSTKVRPTGKCSNSGLVLQTFYPFVCNRLTGFPCISGQPPSILSDSSPSSCFSLLLLLSTSVLPFTNFAVSFSTGFAFLSLSLSTILSITDRPVSPLSFCLMPNRPIAGGRTQEVAGNRGPSRNAQG